MNDMTHWESIAAMRIKDAYVCPHCETVQNVPRCPYCLGESTAPLSTWLNRETNVSQVGPLVIEKLAKEFPAIRENWSREALGL